DAGRIAADNRVGGVPNIANSLPARIEAGGACGRRPGRALIVALQPSPRRSRQLDWRGLAAQGRTNRLPPTRQGRAKTSLDPMIWLAGPDRQAPPSPAS